MSFGMELVVDAGGDVRCVYGEELDLRELGKLHITRASHVEPDRHGFWWADMRPVDGPVLGPFKNRTEALQAERGWLWGRDLPRPITPQNRVKPPDDSRNAMPSLNDEANAGRPLRP